jgi:NADPH:quinone reductase-like Zn-dependent oxidoreductase
MRVIAFRSYGPPEVLELEDWPMPSPAADEILIKIFATTVTAGDCELRGFSLPFSIWWIPVRLFMGLSKPRIKVLGQELAGQVVSVGPKVTDFNQGDRVVAATSMGLGAYAEYICLPAAKAMTHIPDELSYQQATTLPTGGLNGLHFVRKSQLKRGEKVLIVGAGGSIGTYALQLAKLAGAVVTCVDAGEKLDVLKASGADHTIDFQLHDFTELGQSYDVIIEIAGKTSYAKCISMLNPKGRLIIGNPELSWMLLGKLCQWFTGKKVINALAGYRVEDMKYLIELIQKKSVQPVIDKSYQLEQMQEAHHYVEAGHKTGNLIIEVVEVE